MPPIDFTQLEHYPAIEAQATDDLEDHANYLDHEVIPFLLRFHELDKDSQKFIIKEITSEFFEIIHILKTMVDLDINIGASQHYHSDERSG